MKQELLILPEYLSSSPFSLVRIAQSLVICLLAKTNYFCTLLVVLDITAFNYLFGIFKLFFVQIIVVLFYF